MRSITIAIAIWLAIALARPLPAQSQDAPVHCCTVVRVDIKERIVTARETSTGYTFRIEVKNRKHIAAVKVGDKVWADFAARKVRLEAAGDSLCCPIVETQVPSHSRS
jgi:hypothetical protein